MGLSPREVWGVVLWVLYPLFICLFTGICTAYADWRQWYCSLQRSPYSPASWVFGIVWPALYALMSISGALVYALGDQYKGLMHAALAFHFAQLVFVALWTPVFFYARRIQLAMIVIVVAFVLSAVACILSAIVTPWTLLCYLPYLAWLAFAGGVLNLYVVQYNDVELNDKWFDVRTEHPQERDLSNLTGESSSHQ